MKTLLNSLATKNKGNWENLIKDIATQIQETLITSSDLSHILRVIANHPKSLLNNIKVEILDSSSNLCYKFDNSDQSGKPSLTEVIQLDNHGWYECNLSLWISQAAYTKRDLVKSWIINLITAYWKSDLRDDKTRIISEAISKTKELVHNTINLYTEEYNYISYFFSDLDKFKDINSRYGQTQGDSAILQMADLFAKFIVDLPIVGIHRSGDEFIFLCFSNDAETALQFAFDLQSHLKSAEFTLLKDGEQETLRKEITIGMFIQQTYSSIDTKAENYEEAISLAEKAMKDDLGKKRYGTANLSNAFFKSSISPELNNANSNLSKIIIKTCSGSKAFSNVWLNLISGYTEKLKNEAKGLDQLDILLSWLCVANSSLCRTSIPYSSQPDYSKDISIFDVLVSIIRGLYLYETRHNLSNSYKILNEAGILKIVDENSDTIYQRPCELNLKLNVGSCFKEKFAPVCLLIKIGHKKHDIPDNIFSDVIIVDDRPSIGGGLPDFWEVTIARLVSVLHLNKNIVKAYLLGNDEFAQNTVLWLNKLSSETPIEAKEFEEVVYKINSTNILLSTATERLKSNLIAFKTEEEILNSYSNFITEGKNYQNNSVELSSHKLKPFLQKELKLDNNALTNEDGFRVQTLSEAFPLMLEIARKAGINKQIIDQAGAKLGELIDFKVELSNPSSYPIPFYYRNDEEKFKSYFQKQFIEKDGLFAHRLSDQIDVVINHVVEVLSNDNLRYATRRAILVIPNNVVDNELQPFGLVSVRIIPRVEQINRITISYSFTWRTVEALIGFPYSFYGSIKYSEYLTEIIRSRLKGQTIDISLDRVSYIAHSLHIFMDDYGQSIAKRISDDASI